MAHKKLRREPTLVLGASTNPERYAYKATEALLLGGYQVVLVGIKNGSVVGLPILKQFPSSIKIHTLSLYLSAKNQSNYYSEIIACQPKRVIFNPGTENQVLENLLNKHKIKHHRSCTLVLLSTGQYHH